MPTCETRDRVRRPAANYRRPAFPGTTTVKTIRNFLGLGLLCSAMAPLWAVSTAATGPAQPLPDRALQSFVDEQPRTGSTVLVPLVATDAPSRPAVASDAPAGVGTAAGKTLDDLQFVREAAESSHQEADSARLAIPQLKEPRLREVAESLMQDHAAAGQALATIADSKGWPVPAPRLAAAPPAGTASSDFDSKWTADMIAGQERSAALYRAQIESGEDKDLRGYARDTLPTIERHLAQLRSLQK